MYTRAYSHYHSRPVKPTPMELHNYAGCTLALTLRFQKRLAAESTYSTHGWNQHTPSRRCCALHTIIGAAIST